MPNVTLSISDLASRGNDVRTMLLPIAAAEQEGGPAWQPRSSSSEFVIGTHDGSPAGSDYRNWTFSTVISNIRAQYFERWLKFDNMGQEIWYLERAYLHVYIVNRASGDRKEILCLHCDPDDEPDVKLKDDAPEKYQRLLKQSYYKKHPHLHVKVADPPFPHAHIALHVGFLPRISSSVNALTEAMGHAIQMIKDEVLDAMGTA